MNYKTKAWVCERPNYHEDGGVCAIACYAKHKGVDLSKFDREYESDEVGIAAGMPRLVAWKVVALNDIELDTWVGRGEGPEQYPYGYGPNHGIRITRPFTEEERYERVLAWVREQLSPAAQPPESEHP